MNQIGFENFRKFKSFPELEYGGITFLVGANNAGKSTLVKALLLLNGYLKSDDYKHLSFGNNVLEDANIVTYGRAKNVDAEENQIYFQQQLANYFILLSLTGEKNNSFADVNSLVMVDGSNGFTFSFDMLGKSLNITMEQESEITPSDKNIIQELENALTDIERQLKNPDFKKTSKEYIELISEKEKLEKKREDLSLADNNAINKSYEIDGDFGYDNSLFQIVEDVLALSKSNYDRDFKSIQNGEAASKDFETLKAFNDYGHFNISNGIFFPFLDFLKSYTIVYFGTSSIKQSALFSIRDKNNLLAQAIHEFAQLNISNGELEYRFVMRWLKEFEIGEKFTITMHAGDAYEVKIVSGKTEVHLADKGMGSIQAMGLIMKIACVIRKINNTAKHRQEYGLDYSYTIIIEEPELNLHPALQAKLCDLFLEVYEAFKIDFLIETHSEYLIRKSQVLVAEKDYGIAPNKNPFCVYYFSREKEHLPYQLRYQGDGTFDRNFETGFFDTASLETLQLLRIKREKKA